MQFRVATSGRGASGGDARCRQLKKLKLETSQKPKQIGRGEGHSPGSWFPRGGALAAVVMHVGCYSLEVRTSINPCVSHANHPDPTCDRINLLVSDREPRQC
jgi:hypothetical protein